MPLTPEELAGADAARLSYLIEQVLEGRIPEPGAAVADADAPQTPGVAPQYARADHAHGPQEVTEGPPGKSAYASWLEQPGNEGKTEAEFSESLKSTTPGPSNYDVWRALPGNENGNETDYFATLKSTEPGPPGERGTRIYHDAGAPLNAFGQDGDVHFNHASATVIVSFKADGIWSPAFTIGGTTAPPPAPEPPPPAPPPGDILDGSGNVSPSAYLAMAFKMNQAEGIAYRFGQPASLAGVQTLAERADAGNINHGGGNNMPFQFGPENNSDPNLYMSIHAVAIGRPVNGNAIADSVAWLQNFAIDRETAQQRPYRLWQDNPLTPPELRSSGVYRTSGFVLAADNADTPVCAYRGENAPDSPNTRLSLICTQGSPTRAARMFTAGTYTAHNPATLEFPLGMVPTGVTVTGAAELALVSLWDTNTTTGKVAVVALGSAPQGVGWQATGPSQRYDWWHGWRDTCKPGFSDQGNIVFMKIIDMIDLPATMKAPTGIACTTGVHPYTSALKYGPNGIDNFQQLNSPMADNRAKMLPGGEDYERYAKGGVAVVISKSEKSECWIDLQPVFAYLNDMYLGSAAKNLETQNLGFGPTQWPYSLADKPAARATVVKTVTYAERPLAVLTTGTYSWWSKDDQTRRAPPNDMYWDPDPHYPRSWTAFENGSLRIHSLGRYAAGVKPTPDRAPGDIVLVGTVTGLGNGITQLAANKGIPAVGDDLNDGVIYVARADRKIGYVAFETPASGTTTTGTAHTLVQDSRMDPVKVAIVDPYHTESNVATVADYTGACIRNYRYGPIIYGGDTVWEPAPLNTPGATPPGEYCGELALPFRPIDVHCSNTP